MLGAGLGVDPAEVEMFFNRSQNFRNVWNEEHQYFCARDTAGV